MSKQDYSTWFTKQQAAEAVGVSTKTIEKLVDQKQLQRVYWKRPETGAKVAVYHPDDVNRIRKERNPAAEAFVLPASSAPLPELHALTVAGPPSADNLMRILTALVDTHSQNSQNTVRIAERIFLTMREAADYSGLPQAHLRRLIDDGELQGLKTGAGWRVRRAHLEKL